MSIFYDRPYTIIQLTSHLRKEQLKDKIDFSESIKNISLEINIKQQ